jgi:hypothetical protein
MISNTDGLTRHDLEAKIVKRCWEDEGFRKEFTADPAATFVKYLQVPASSLPKTPAAPVIAVLTSMSVMSVATITVDEGW